MTRKTIFSLLGLFALLILGTGLAVGADWTPAAPAGDIPEVIYRGVSTAIKFDISPPLRDLAQAAKLDVDFVEIPERDSGLEGPLGPQDTDPLVQSLVGPNLIPEPLISFDGPSNLAFVSPPDPVGDVGPDHYVAMSNLYSAIYAKDGTELVAPFPNNALWSGFGGDCQTDNSGDPIVVYDQMADRWILTQFTSSGPTFFNCVALSTGPDPTGTYYRYAVGTGTNFPDYPKYGIWPDAYYISTREFAGAFFAGVGAYAMNRAQMLVGDPSPDIVSFLVPPGGTPYNVGDGLLPSDMDGSALPPAGSPNYFMGSMDNGGPYGAPQDALTLWEFEVDFDTPANSSFTLVDTIPVAPYDSQFPCSPTSRNCIPQPDTTNKIDILSYRQRPMWRLAYRNFGSHEVLVTNQSVEAAPNMAGIRWWEIRDPGGTPIIYQEGTYAPGVTDGIHRWMGSIAMDSSGNMALGYSASDATTTYPSSWYTGRLANDPLGTMPQGEGSIIDGTGSQTGSGRWGDYTSMNVDPVDDCTFWYVNEYLPVTSSVGWRLRIGAFKFDECGETDFTLAAVPESQAICSGSSTAYDVVLGSLLGFSAPVTLSSQGEPVGSVTSFNPNPATPPMNSTMTLTDDGSSPAGTYDIDIIGMSTTRTHTTTVELVLYDDVPGVITPIAPADGATGIDAAPTFTWTQDSQAIDYILTIASDPGFNNVVYMTTTVENSLVLPVLLAAETTYYWQVSGNNSCGQGASSVVSSFTIRVYPKVLLVDDDDNTPDSYPTYEFVLNTLGVEFEVWDTNNSDDEPPLMYYEPYETVIWFTGDSNNSSTGPGPAGEAALENFLYTNKCLMISSQSYYNQRGLTPFMQIDLGVDAVTNDTGQTSVSGVGGIFGGLGPYALNYFFANQSDTITPDGTAAVGFDGNAGSAAVTKEYFYRTTFLGFPFETIPTTTGRVDTMNAFFDWCDELHIPDAGDDQAGSTWAGQTISYTFTITNAGAVFDEYLLTVESDWEFTQSHYESGPMGPGDTVDVTIVVQVPAGAAVGEMDTATLTVRSLHTSSIATHTQAVTTVIEEPPPPPEEDFLMFLPVVLKQP